MLTAILDTYPCPVCHQSHDLCSSDAGGPDGPAEYEYVCPKTGQTVRVRPFDWNLMDVAFPGTMVPLSRVT